MRNYIIPAELFQMDLSTQLSFGKHFNQVIFVDPNKGRACTRLPTLPLYSFPLH